MSASRTTPAADGKKKKFTEFDVEGPYEGFCGIDRDLPARVVRYQFACLFD